MNWRREGPCRGSPELALLEGWGQLIGPGPGARLPLAFCQIGDQMYRSSGRGHLVGWWAGWEAPGQKMQALGWRRGRLRDTPVEPAHHTFLVPSGSRMICATPAGSNPSLHCSWPPIGCPPIAMPNSRPINAREGVILAWRICSLQAPCNPRRQAPLLTAPWTD